MGATKEDVKKVWTEFKYIYSALERLQAQIDVINATIAKTL